MATVSIDGVDYTAYATVDYADAYLGASFTATAWRDETDEDVKGRALVESARLLDRQRWLPDYDTFAEREDVDDIVNASIELAALLVGGDTDFLTASTTESNTRRLKAGSAEIEFFRPTTAVATRLPYQIHEMLRDYLGGGDWADAGVLAYGTDDEAANLDFGATGGL